MTNFKDLKNFFKESGYNMIIASDADPKVFSVKNGKVITESSAGGVAVALDPIAQATNATYIARAKNTEVELPLNKDGATKIEGTHGEYQLKRLLIDKKIVDNYYLGFSNQTLWPLCHIAFEEPIWTNKWYEDYKKVNREFANAIKESLSQSKKNFVWINDYQLAMVPYYLGKQKDTTVGMFWHIPWPTWEIFRILPYKRELLESLLNCDFVAFHRGYQARNFLQTVERELETRTDEETQKVYYNKGATTVKSLPMGIDTDVVKSQVKGGLKNGKLVDKISENIGIETNQFDKFFKEHKLILSISRLDYTKGIKFKLRALDLFFKKNPEYREKVIYISIIAPSREPIPSYQKVKEEALALTDEINKRYGTNNWRPIHLIYETFDRHEVINFYHRADACIITPVDDGMNLVSKEFVVASSLSDNPGMLVLSQFAGSAIDLTSALIVNPYDTDEMAEAIKRAIEMPQNERLEKTRQMTEQLESNNVYEWASNFIKESILTQT